MPEQVLVERLVKRGLTSGRADDNEETIKARIAVFNESTQPVLNTYNKFGKVVNINGMGEIEQIYNSVRQNIIPNISFLYGAPSIGKSQIAKKLSAFMNYSLLDLSAFYKQNKLDDDIDRVNALMTYFS